MLLPTVSLRNAVTPVTVLSPPSVLLKSARFAREIGTGTLTLSGDNTYTGGTSVTGDVLKVVNTTGSATGTGLVSVDVGTLSGNGIIGGAVVLGTGTGAGAVIDPADRQTYSPEY